MQALKTPANQTTPLCATQLLSYGEGDRGLYYGHLPPLDCCAQYSDSYMLSEQCQRHLRHQVGLCQHGNTGLSQHLVLHHR